MSLALSLDASVPRAASSGSSTILPVPAYVAQVNGPSDGPRAPYYDGSSFEANADNPSVVALTAYTQDYAGSDATGADVFLRRTNYLRGRQRQTWTDGVNTDPVVFGTPTLRTLIPSGYVGPADKLYTDAAGTLLTNNATTPPPIVMARWHTVPGQILGAGVRIGVLAFQKYGRLQLPVAKVSVTGAPTTGSPVTKVHVYGASGQYGDTTADDWGATWADSDFPSNGTASVTFTCTVIPWIGRAAATRTTATAGGTFPDIGKWTPMPMYTGTPTIQHAVVDSTLGVDLTGVVSTTYATAYLTPFATDVGALNKILTVQTDVSFCVVTFKAGSHTWTMSTTLTGATRTCRKGWLQLRGDPADSDPYNNVQVTLSGQNRVWFTDSIPNYGYVRFSNLKITSAASSNLGNMGAKVFGWLDHVNLSVNNGSTSILGACPMAWATNCDCAGAGSKGLGLSSTNQRFEMVYNCRSLKDMAANVLSCNTTSGTTGTFTLGEGGGNLAQTNVIAYNCIQTGLTTGVAFTFPLVAGTPSTITDVAVVQCLITGTNNAMLAVTVNDRQRHKVTNVIWLNCTSSPTTTAGNYDSARVNWLFDGPTTGLPTVIGDLIPWSIHMAKINSLCGRDAHKGDIFQRVNNADTGASFFHGALPLTNSLDSPYTQSEWSTDDNFRHDYMGIGGSQKAPITYAARDSGNFHPSANYPVVPLEYQHLARDLAGATRATAGSASGAYCAVGE